MVNNQPEFIGQLVKQNAYLGSNHRRMNRLTGQLPEKRSKKLRKFENNTFLIFSTWITNYQVKVMLRERIIFRK